MGLRPARPLWRPSHAGALDDRGGLRTLERASPGVLHTDLVATNGYKGGEPLPRR